MEYFRHIGKIDGMGERRENQFKHEQQFDTHVVPLLLNKCGATTVTETLLLRARINRVMCRNIANAGLLKKLDLYDEFLEDIDNFNTVIDKAVRREIADSENNKDNGKSVCKSLDEFNKTYSSMAKYAEISPKKE